MFCTARASFGLFLIRVNHYDSPPDRCMTKYAQPVTSLYIEAYIGNIGLLKFWDREPHATCRKTGPTSYQVTMFCHYQNHYLSGLVCGHGNKVAARMKSRYKFGNGMSHSTAITWIVAIAILTTIYYSVSVESQSNIRPWLEVLVWLYLGGITVKAFVIQVGTTKRKQQRRKEQWGTACPATPPLVLCI